MNIRNEPLAQNLSGPIAGWLAVWLTLPAWGQAQEESASSSRFSDQPAPLMREGFPERPPPLIEWGDKLLGPGNLQQGFTLPTGANWSPSLWVYGDYRSAVQTFNPGKAPTISEWANRLDLYANLQLTGTERVLVGFRPIDQVEDGVPRYSGYSFEPAYPEKYHGWQNETRAAPNTFFFEGEFGEIFPKLAASDRHNLDYGFSIGRQPLLLQDGLLVNDDKIDMISVTRNPLFPAGAATVRLSGLFAWNEIQRADNLSDHHALMFGLDSAVDAVRSTYEATALYVASPNQGDGFYSGLGARQRFGKINTIFRIEDSVALEKESARVRNGTLLFSEMSFDPRGTHDLVYLDGFWAIDKFSSADRGPYAGGPLIRAGLLNANPELGQYGSPLSNAAGDAAGANLGYQHYFDPLRRSQLILEIGGRAPTRTTTVLEDQASGGIAARYQRAFGRRVVLEFDTFGVLREKDALSAGARTEILVKF